MGANTQSTLYSENNIRSESRSNISSRFSSCSSSSSSSSTTDSSSEDNDDLLYDQTYVPDQTNNQTDSEADSPENSLTSPTTSSSLLTLDSSVTSNIPSSPAKKGRKRKRDENTWKRSLNKKFRNTGREYEMHCKEKKVRSARAIKPPCTEKCKLECSSKFTEEERKAIFQSYWDLGNLDKQRQFIANNMESVHPRYQYVRVGGTRNKRSNNNAFYFHFNNVKVRVCKLFFRNTLDINDRNIRTVQNKRNKVANALVEEDNRGKHGKQKKIDIALKEGVRSFIEKIPKIESHYTRANTSKLFIDGSKSIAELHTDYINDCKNQNMPFVNYIMFYRIFTEEFNVSFFTPKKDLCETCASYDNAEGDEKEKLKTYYDQHLVEKELSREQKKK